MITTSNPAPTSTSAAPPATVDDRSMAHPTVDPSAASSDPWRSTRQKFRSLGRGTRLGLAAVISGSGAAISGWMMPHGPYTTTQALLAMGAGAAAGAAAGVVARTRWATVLAPTVFASVFELTAWSHGDVGSGDWIVARAFHGAVGLAPLALGASLGAAFARRREPRPPRGSWSAAALVARRTIATVATVALGALAVVVARPANPDPIRDADGTTVAGSLVEKIRVEIGGVRQGMFIEATDVDNPLLLVVHGGPGMPEHWLTERYPTGLEEHFTVIWWEQRGAGLSYAPDIDPATMTVSQFVDDTIEVTRYLLDRFDREQLYLLGHSWGSFIGLQAVDQAPELYAAYIGVGQVVHQLESEQIAYEYALEHFERLGDQRMLDRLHAAPPGAAAPLPGGYMALRDEYMHRAGIGTTRDMRSVISGLFLPSWTSGDYTLVEKVNLWRGKISSRRPEIGLWDAVLTTDLRRTVPAVDVPVYFLHGRHDYTCAHPLALDYFERIDAPVKRFHTFEQSAHSPMFEEPEATIEILLADVLAGSDPQSVSNRSTSVG